MSQYKIIVEFTRERDDDEDVIKHHPNPKYKGLSFKEAAVQLLRDELQEAYDKSWLGGSFKITKVDLPKEN